MLFSLAGIIQSAEDENQANAQIDDVWRSVWANSYKPNLYAINAIFETEELEKFMKELNNALNEFLQNYKEK